MVSCQLSAADGSASGQMEGEFQLNGLKGKSSNTQSTKTRHSNPLELDHCKEKDSLELEPVMLLRWREMMGNQISPFTGITQSVMVQEWLLKSCEITYKELLVPLSCLYVIYKNTANSELAKLSITTGRGKQLAWLCPRIKKEEKNPLKSTLKAVSVQCVALSAPGNQQRLWLLPTTKQSTHSCNSLALSGLKFLWVRWLIFEHHFQLVNCWCFGMAAQCNLQAHLTSRSFKQIRYNVLIIEL